MTEFLELGYDSEGGKLTAKVSYALAKADNHKEIMTGSIVGDSWQYDNNRLPAPACERCYFEVSFLQEKYKKAAFNLSVSNSEMLFHRICELRNEPHLYSDLAAYRARYEG